jgi:sugar phosphate permease
MTRFFYGWITLAAIFLVYASGTIGISTLPLVNAQLKDQFGWTHEQITFAPSLLFLMMAVMSPFAGALLDKMNPKRILLIGWICFVAALLLYSTVSSLWQYALVYVIYSVGSVCTGVIPGIYIISKWFKHYRGIATGIFTVGSSFGGLVFPKLAAYWLASGHSWQNTGLMLAGATAACAAVPWLFVRNVPEEVGATIDGKPVVEHKAKETQEMKIQVSEAQMNNEHTATHFAEQAPQQFSALFGSLTFYLILFITAAVWFCVTPMIQHLAFHMKDLKIELTTSATVLQILFACSIVGKLTFGWASSYADKKWILLVATLCMAGGSALVLLTNPERVNNVALLYAAAVVYGIGFSGSFTMVQLLVATEYSKHQAFGKILGAVAMFDSLAGVAGISALGRMRTTLGNYEAAFTMLTLVGLCAATGVMMLKLRERMKLKTV